MSIFDSARVFIGTSVDGPTKTQLTSKLRADKAVVPRKFSTGDDFIVVSDNTDPVYAECETAGHKFVVTPEFIIDHLGKSKASSAKKYFVSGSSSPKAAAPAKAAPAKRSRAASPSPTPTPAPAAAAPARRGRAAAAAAAAPPSPVAAPAKPAAKKADAKKSDAAPAPAAAAPAKKMTTVTMVGRAPVDALVPGASNHSVYHDANLVYDFMLNQTNIGHNNNKFYLIQVLQSSTGYATWFRWGRVGADGQSKYQQFATVDRAISNAQAKFSDKSGGFRFRDTLSDMPVMKGKYTFIKREYAEKDDLDAAEDEERKSGGKVTPDSKLAPQVKSLVELICNVQLMKQQMLEVGYDAERLPLGKISKDVVKRGYVKVKEISDVVDALEDLKAAKGTRRRVQRSNPNKGKSESALRAMLTELSSEFYTVIPHAFGMRAPPIINTVQMVKDKIEMLDALAEIECATKLIKLDDKDAPTVHPADQHYDRLQCDITPLPESHPMHSVIVDYVANTHGKTHYIKVKPMDIFEINRHGETERFEKAGSHKDHNRQLLWHGSRLTNFVGILSQGLRIAPPEAPATGYMFGKGVYLADAVSKSANYCCSHSSNKEGILLLCEAALGDPNELTHADFNASDLPDGKHSTKGLGRTVPRESDALFADDAFLKGQVNKKAKSKAKPETCLKVPMGVCEDVKKDGLYLQYNEFIVYNINQIRMKYLIRWRDSK